MKIHFVGIGKMGLPMAGHLLAAGHALSLHDPDPTRLGLAKSAQLSQRDFTPTFTVEQMLKDLGLILGAGLAPLPRGTP